MFVLIYLVRTCGSGGQSDTPEGRK